MGLLNRTGVSLQHIDDDVDAAPPSMLALVKQMRDPQVRRGLGRTLALLRTVGGENQPAGDVPGPTRTP
jgi:uncharacterized protein YjgD (DUF1641 family)